MDGAEKKKVAGIIDSAEEIAGNVDRAENEWVTGFLERAENEVGAGVVG